MEKVQNETMDIFLKKIVKQNIDKDVAINIFTQILNKINNILSILIK